MGGHLRDICILQAQVFIGRLAEYFRLRVRAGLCCDTLCRACAELLERACPNSSDDLRDGRDSRALLPISPGPTNAKGKPLCSIPEGYSFKVNLGILTGLIGPEDRHNRRPPVASGRAQSLLLRAACTGEVTGPGLALGSLSTGLASGARVCLLTGRPGLSLLLRS